MEIEQNHNFGIDEARKRVQALGDYLAKKHGMTVEWLDADRARIRGKYAVVSIDAEARIEAGRVSVSGKDPGLLWRVPAKKYITTKLASYLDPARQTG